MRFNQQTDLSSPHTFQRSILGLFIAFICALFAAGCSSGSGGSDGFVANPTGAPGGGGGAGNAGNGSVTYNFVRAQANAIVVPATTVSLRFEFFTGLEGTGAIVKRETRDFATTITIENVPTSARSSVITAITAEGFPVATFTSNQTVPLNGDVTVDATAGTLTPVVVSDVQSSPISVNLATGDTGQIVITAVFSNGDEVRLDDGLQSLVNFSSSDLSIVTVDADGNLTAGVGGTATVTATFQGQTVEVAVRVGSGITPDPLVTMLEITSVEPEPVALPVGTVSQPLTVTATYDTGLVRDVNQETTPPVVFTSTDPNITVNSMGQIAVSNQATPNDTATITATFQGATDTIQVQVLDVTLVTLEISPSSVSLPFGGFEQQVSAVGTYSDGNQFTLDPDSQLTFTESSALFDVDDVTGTVISAASGTQGTANLTVQTVVGPAVPNVLTETVPVTVGELTVTTLTIEPNPVTLAPGEVQEFTVTATLSDMSTVDVSDFASLDISTARSEVVVNGRQVVAVEATPDNDPAPVTFDIPGSGSTPTDVLVTVESEVLESVDYLFGGIPVVENPQTGVNGANLPRGYVGIFEVIGTFNTGVVRRLRPSEYQVVPEAAANGKNGAAIALFDNSYDIDITTEVTTSYFDGAPLPGTGPSFSDDDAEVDDFYFIPRDVRDFVDGDRGSTESPSVDFAFANSFNPEDINGEVLTRDTFRAVVADWHRGSDYLANAGTASPFVAQSPKSRNPFSPDGDRVAPGSVREFEIQLAPSVTGEAAFGDSDLDDVITITIVDPLSVEVASAGFTNYNGEDFARDDQIPVGTVREYEVRVNFSAVTTNDQNSDTADEPAFGPTVSAINNWKLAEANVALDSAAAGANQFIFHTPTELGFIGIASNEEVVDNIIRVRAQPVLGDVLRATATVPPDLDPDYVAGVYEDVNNVFGASGDFTPVAEGPLFGPRDPGPGPNDQKATRAPQDGFLRVITEVNVANPVQILDPVLFSIDPINPGGTDMGADTAIELAVGASQIFRTMIQYTSNQPFVDRSLDYPPRAIIDDANPAAVARGELNANNNTTGRLILSGINAMGSVVNYMFDDSPFKVYNESAEVVVVAEDAVGEPIRPRGNFAGEITDLRGQTGPAQAVTTVDVVD